MKESWKTINELINERSKSNNIDSLEESGSETVHEKDIPAVVKLAVMLVMLSMSSNFQRYEYFFTTKMLFCKLISVHLTTFAFAIVPFTSIPWSPVLGPARFDKQNVS